MTGLYGKVSTIDNWLGNQMDNGDLHIWLGLNGDESEYGLKSTWMWDEVRHNWY